MISKPLDDTVHQTAEMEDGMAIRTIWYSTWKMTDMTLAKGSGEAEAGAVVLSGEMIGIATARDVGKDTVIKNGREGESTTIAGGGREAGTDTTSAGSLVSQIHCYRIDES